MEIEKCILFYLQCFILDVAGYLSNYTSEVLTFEYSICRPCIRTLHKNSSSDKFVFPLRWMIYLNRGIQVSR